MITRKLSQAMGVMALVVVASSAYGQVTINIASATFSSNPGNLTNAGAASGGANSLHSAVETASYPLGANVTVNSADVTSVGAGTYSDEPGFKLENSGFPGLFTYFRLSAVAGTYVSFSVAPGSILGLGASGPYTWNTAATLPTQSAIASSSTWNLEAYESYDDDVAGTDSTGANISFKVNAYSPPPPPPAWPNQIPGHSVLYDNGNPGNAVGLGAGGANASVLGVGSVNFGLGVSSAANLSLVDDFTVPAGPSWNVSLVSGYAYLTGAGTAAAASGVIAKIWLGDPQFGGTLVASTTALSSSAWSGVYRVLDAANILLTNRALIAVRADFGGLTLAPGAYYVEYSITGLSFTPPVMDAVYPPSTTAPGNSRQYNSGLGTWTNLLDPAGIDMPFTIYRLAPSQNITGNLVLGDTVGGAFAFNRAMSYELKQGATTLASGTINAGTSSTPFSINAGAATGSAQLILNGSSFLRRVVAINLTGSNQAIGTATMQNGDVNNSGEVDAVDIDDVVANFGFLGDDATDVDVNGEVDAVDIDIVIANFGGLDD